MNNRQYKRVLTIAGSDSGGGAGIQADLKAISACGAYGMTAITAITAQNTRGVSGIHPVPVEMIEKQIRAVVEDIGVDAVKIGMLHSAEVIETVARLLKEYQCPHIVLDPVMVATSGDKLLQDEAIDALKSALIPLADLITPNIPEAAILLGKKELDTNVLPAAARELGKLGSKAVLLKSGHIDRSRLTDILFESAGGLSYMFDYKRIETDNTHGTGCTLSSAIAASLALGHPLQEAVRLASDYIHEAIARGADYTLGGGHGPVHHFYKFWN